MSVLREIRVQTDPSVATRIETHLGREYLVAPVIMLVEGVLQGANAAEPEYCSAEAMSNLAIQWNGRPIVMNHPKVNGSFVSANYPQVLADWQFGFVFNTEYVEADGGNKLRAEAWIDTARALELGGDFQDAVDRINAGEIVEVSTGLFCDVIPSKGKFNSTSYSGVWTNVVSDHLAILSAGIIGACSVAGGCGIPRLNEAPKVEGPWGIRPQEMRLNTAALRQVTPNLESVDHCCETCKGTAVNTNEIMLIEPTVEELAVLSARGQLAVNAIPGDMTHEDARKLVRASLAKKLGQSYVYLAAMTADQVIYESYPEGYCCGGSDWKMWSINYTVADDGSVSFSDDPQEVVLTTKITPVVNEAAEGVQPAVSTTATSEEEDDMSTNSGQNAGGAASTAVPPTPAVQAEPETQASASAAPAAEPAALAAKFNNTQDWLDSAPPEIAALMRDQLTRANSEKMTKITAIKANSANKFSDEQLNSMDLTMLESIAALSVNSQTVASDDRGPGDDNARLNYGGRGGIAVQSRSLDPAELERVNADTTKHGGPKAVKVFEQGESSSFGPRVGAYRKSS